MKNKKYIIYLHTFPNNKVYIGQTCRKLSLRWLNGKGYRENQPRIHNAIKKYGWNNIKHRILMKDLTLEEANYYEKELINFFDSTNKNKGYNISLGGENVGSKSEESIEKWRQKVKGNKYPWTKEIHRQIIYKNLDKMIEKSKIKIKQVLSKKIIHLETGNIYASTLEASKALNIHRYQIGAVCRKERRHTHGQHFLYINKNDDINKLLNDFKLNIENNNLKGKRFGHLTVLETFNNKNDKYYSKCKCDCGNEKIISNKDLLRQHNTTCGIQCKLYNKRSK